VKFFTQQGVRLDQKAGLFGKIGVLATFGVATAWGKLFSGTQNGSLVEWEGRSAIKAHKVQGVGKSNIQAILFNGEHLICGAEDGSIHFVTVNMRDDRCIRINTITSSLPGI